MPGGDGIRLDIDFGFDEKKSRSDRSSSNESDKSKKSGKSEKGGY